MRKLLWLLPATLTLILVLSLVTSVNAQADFRVTDLNINPQPVKEGELVTISANVTNTQEEQGTYELQLIINGEVKDTQQLTLDAGASEPVIFTITAGSPGDYFVELGDSSDIFVVSAGSFWSIFPTWVWVAIVVIVVLLILVVIVLAATPPRKKQPDASLGGGRPSGQVYPGAEGPMPTPTSGPGPAMSPTGYQDTMPTPGAYQSPGAFPTPAPMTTPYPSPAGRAIFSVSNLTITPNQVKAGQPVTISAIVSNNGSAAGRYSVVLRVNGVVENITELTLPPGGSQATTFTLLKDDGGDYYTELDGLGGTFTVIPLVPADFSVSNLAIAPERVKQGESITIGAIVTNNGEISGNYSLVLKLKGAVESVEEVSLGPGESQRVAFNVTKTTPGFYNVELEGLTGRFVIEMEWQ